MIQEGYAIRGDRLGKRANDWYVGVLCPKCEETRWVLRWKLKLLNFTELCWTCSARQNIKNRFKGKQVFKSMERKPKPSQQGSKNPNWKGGLTELVKGIRRSPEYYQWRKSILMRDNYTCQDCGGMERVEAHHVRAVIDYPEGIFGVDNGLTVCETCHDRHTFWQKLKRSRR